jgi:hypothetical protein
MFAFGVLSTYSPARPFIPLFTLCTIGLFVADIDSSTPGNLKKQNPSEHNI